MDTSNQGIAALAHYMDELCFTCAHRWGNADGGRREICAQCRLFDARPVRYQRRREENE